MTDVEIRRAWCLSGVLNFTRYMFAKNTRTRFIVGDHHRRICEALDRVVAGKCRRLIINMPPRYSKTEIVSKNFIAYGLALNPAARFIHLSYSEDLVLSNSRAINEMCQADYFRELFPSCEVKGTNAKQWLTSQGGGVYAVSSAGQVTGFGAGLVEAEDSDAVGSATFGGAIVIDDPLKADEAVSDVCRERVNMRFESTIRNRVNSRNTPIIVVMQRLHEHDLCGYLQSVEPDTWEVLSLPALSVDDNGNEVALWEHKHTIDELHELRRVNGYVFETQYQQNPKPLEGLMYPQPFKTYEVLPLGGTVKNYTDTADTGADYLCSICYVEVDGCIYVTDVLYTTKPMEYTEVECAKMLARNNVQLAMVESNNGGRGFARNVERNLRTIGNRTTSVQWFTQRNNKDARIFGASAEVQNVVYMPQGWEFRWAEFAQAIKGYRKAGGNKHDDAPDALTGSVEQIKKINKTNYNPLITL